MEHLPAALYGNGLVHIEVLNATGLIKMDINGKADPYVRLGAFLAWPDKVPPSLVVPVTLTLGPAETSRAEPDFQFYRFYFINSALYTRNWANDAHFLGGIIRENFQTDVEGVRTVEGLEGVDALLVLY